MDRIALMNAASLMNLVMDHHGISWQSTLGYPEYERPASERPYIDIGLVVIGLSKGYMKMWLMISKERVPNIAAIVGFEYYIRRFIKYYFEIHTPDDMLNVFTIIVFILETSVLLYSKDVEDAPSVGIRVLAHVFGNEIPNQGLPICPLKRLHNSAIRMLYDRRYTIGRLTFLALFYGKARLTRLYKLKF